MRPTVCVLAASLLIALACIAQAADDNGGSGNGNGPPAKQGIMKGVITKVEAASITFKDKKGPEVTVATTDSTGTLQCAAMASCKGWYPWRCDPLSSISSM